MAGMNSPRYDIIKLGNLIKNYINNEHSSAGSELSKQIISGEDLLDAFDYIYLEMAEIERENKEYEKLEGIFNMQREAFLEERKNYKGLIKNIELLIKEKEGPFIDKIKDIIKK